MRLRNFQNQINLLIHHPTKISLSGRLNKTFLRVGRKKNYNRIYVKRVLMNSTQLMKAIINVNKKDNGSKFKIAWFCLNYFSFFFTIPKIYWSEKKEKIKIFFPSSPSVRSFQKSLLLNKNLKNIFMDDCHKKHPLFNLLTFILFILFLQHVFMYGM